MITRRQLLKGLAASVAAAILVTVAVKAAPPRCPCGEYHDDYLRDWRKTRYPGNYDEAIQVDGKMYGRQAGWAKTRAFARGEITYEEYAG